MILIILIILVISLVLYNYVQCWKTLKESKLPFLPLIPIIGHVHLMVGPNDVFFQKMLNLLNRFNSLGLYIGPFFLPFVYDIEIVSHLFKWENQHMKAKAAQYRFLGQLAQSTIFVLEGAEFKQSKKVLMEAVSHVNLKEFIHKFNSNAKNLVHTLKTKPDANFEFDLKPELNFASISILLDTIMGLETYAITKEEIIIFSKKFSKLLSYIILRGYSIWLYPDFIYKRSKLFKVANAARNHVRGVCERMIHARKTIFEENIGKEDNEKRTSVFVDRYFKSKKDNGDEYTSEEIIDDVSTMIGAGFETSVSTIGFALMLLAMNQDIQQKLYEEINAQIRDDDQDISADDLNACEYLDQVIQETWRLYPVVPGMGRSITKDIELPNGGRLKKGTDVWFIAFMMHRDPEIYPDPLTFNPDNFLSERVKDRPPEMFIPFGFGARKCFGAAFAKLSIKTMMCHLLKNFRFYTTKTENDFRLSFELTLNNIGGFPLSVKPRNKI